MFPREYYDERIYADRFTVAKVMIKHEVSYFYDTRGPIYKESYAGLMTAQDLHRTYAELMNCERLTKNHKLNLRKIYAKLRTYDHINAVITQS